MRSFLAIVSTALCGIGGASAWAVPSINITDTGAGLATLEVVVDSPGSVAVELAVEAAYGLTLVNAAIADSLTFDTANPGDNPFLEGSPIGGDASGLFADFDNGWVFAAIGSAYLEPGVYELLELNYEFCIGGELTAFGTVAQGGVQTVGLVDALSIATAYLYGDMNNDGIISTLDIDPFVLALTDPPAYEAMSPPCLAEIGIGDINGDGVLNTLDIDPFVALLTGGGAALASKPAPEPAATVLAGMALTALMRRRSRQVCQPQGRMLQDSIGFSRWIER